MSWALGTLLVLGSVGSISITYGNFTDKAESIKPCVHKVGCYRIETRVMTYMSQQSAYLISVDC